MSERERRFNEMLEHGRAAGGYGAPDADLGDLVNLARELRDVRVPEARMAKARVWRQLEGALERDARIPPAAATAASARRPALGATRANRLVWAVAAALLLVCGVLGWGANSAAAAALPGDPLYGVKRAQEWLALETAVGDARVGVVYTMLADHRLTEASGEADRGNTPLVMNLLGEYNTAVQQAVGISANMAARGEDNTQVLAAVAAELDRAAQVQSAAAAHGQSAFAQALGQSIQENLHAVESHHLQLPHGGNPNGQPGHPQGAATPSPGAGGHGSNHADQTPTPGTGSPVPATPTPHGSGGSGHAITAP